MRGLPGPSGCGARDPITALPVQLLACSFELLLAGSLVLVLPALVGVLARLAAGGGGFPWFEGAEAGRRQGGVRALVLGWLWRPCVLENEATPPPRQ
jgi:hypothetical protein